VKWAAVVLGLWCAGCATSVHPLPSRSDQLQTAGYKSDGYIWWKEFRDPNRVYHYCFVPAAPQSSAGYKWKISVLVDGRAVWDWGTGDLRTRSGLWFGMSCVETPQLPEGRVTYSVQYLWWQ
jgi:hypothetical protein